MIKRIINLIIILLVLDMSLVGASFGADFSGAVTLESLISEAFQNSPRIKSARYGWGAAIETIPQAGTLPDPMFSATYFPEPIETRLGPNDYRFMITQGFPYPGKLSIMENMAGLDAKASRISYQREIREVVTELSLSYFELLYIQRALEITRQNKDILEALAKIGAADYALDSTSLSDVLTAQSQLAQLNYDFILLEELKDTEITKINTILNRPPESELVALENVAVKIPYDLDEMYNIMVNNQEEIKILNTGIEKMESAGELAKLSSYPDFKVELIYSEIGKPQGMSPDDAGRDSYGITIGATIPLWATKNESRVREKDLKLREMVEMRNARVNMNYSMIKNLYFKMNNAQRLMELYSKTLMPQAETTMAKAEEWYKQEKGSYAQLLETQSVLLNFNLAYERASADHNKYAVKLQNLLGIEIFGADGGAIK